MSDHQHDAPDFMALPFYKLKSSDVSGHVSMICIGINLREQFTILFVKTKDASQYTLNQSSVK
jgi:hypothetical protein